WPAALGDVLPRGVRLHALPGREPLVRHPDAWGSPHRGARLDWDAPRGDASAPPAEPSFGLRHARSAIARVEPRTRHARRGSLPPRAEGGAPRGGSEGRCAKVEGPGDRGAVSRGTADHAPRLCDPHA